jgi:hypothetical protein
MKKESETSVVRHRPMRGIAFFLLMLALVLLGNLGAYAITWPDTTITTDPTVIQSNVGSVFNTAFGTGVTVIGLMLLVGFIIKGLRARKG